MLNKLAKLREERAEGDNENGFTLIELLVVVVIIGILVAIAIPLYLNYRTGAENKSAQSDVRSAVSAVEACISDNANKVPTGTNVSGTGNLYMTCKGSGVLSTSSTNADQTINISDSVTITYNANATANTYTLKGTYSGSGHKFYLYDSSTGKTTNPTS